MTNNVVEAMVKLHHTLESYQSYIPLNRLSRTCFFPFTSTYDEVF